MTTRSEPGHKRSRDKRAFHHGRPGPQQGKRRREGHARTSARRPDPRLDEVLGQIGVPEEAVFRPDAFQKEALQLLPRTDVLVTAPTGAGKTWIAVEAIRACLEAGRSAWYACPLKALSNAKYEELTATFGLSSVGILTGDRRENAAARLIVGTTEILRNQLYDAMTEKALLPFELVILDEAHFLGDRERGVVWEETLIYLPSHTRLLLLSASIQNSREIADWLSSVRGVDCSVVTAVERPVPLHPLFLFPGGRVGLLTGRRGLAGEVVGYLQSQAKARGKAQTWPFRWNPSRIIGHLREYNLLPAIFFLKSRADCDRAVANCRPAPRSPEEDQAFDRDLQELLERFPYLRNHRALPDLVAGRVASHHAGLLPYWKVLVEQLMLKGHLDAIFATSTVAGGVNFPARTVVLVQSDRFNGREFQDLSATDLQQMIGRAGRRGKDQVGFALVVPGPFQDPHLIHQRLISPPDPIESQIRINFSMVLNLLQSHTPEDVKVVLDESLAAFQQSVRRKAHGRAAVEGQPERKAPRQDVRQALWEDFLRHKTFLADTGFVDEEDRLTWIGKYAAQLRLDHPILVAEAIRSGAFEGVSPAVLAAMIGTFVGGSERREGLDAEMKVSSREVSQRVARLQKDLKELIRLLKKHRFETPDIPLWPAQTLYLWAKGVSWDALLRTVPLEDGDLAMLIIRTADHLNQLVGLRGSHPDLAEVAGQAVPLILREPVWI